MPTGTVKFFSTQRGFGFIQPDDGSKDVFVHISEVERSGIGSLHEGQKVSFEARHRARQDRGGEAPGSLIAGGAADRTAWAPRIGSPALGPIPAGDELMPFRPNYRQSRGERDRAKQQKKDEKLRRRELEPPAGRRSNSRKSTLRRSRHRTSPCRDTTCEPRSQREDRQVEASERPGDQAMKLFIFQSGGKSGLRAFTGDADGKMLPPKFAPWGMTGIVAAARRCPRPSARRGRARGTL